MVVAEGRLSFGGCRREVIVRTLPHRGCRTVFTVRRTSYGNFLTGVTVRSVPCGMVVIAARWVPYGGCCTVVDHTVVAVQQWSPYSRPLTVVAVRCLPGGWFTVVSLW